LSDAATHPVSAVLRRRISDELEALSADGLRRRLAPARGVDFSSSDYLGLANDRCFRNEVARRITELAASRGDLFAPSARLLRGETDVHARLEQRLAAWKGAERALLLPSGWQANAALLGGVLRTGDRVISDALNHASLIDGMRAVGCERVVVPHLDLDAFRRALDRPWPDGESFVVVEALYSMDGDRAPLGEISELCEQRGAHLIVDEAHASGIYGENGSGWIEACGVAPRVLASVTTLGKALAVQGAAICGSSELIDLVLHRGRAFVYSTAISPLLLVAVEAALDLVAAEPERRRRLHSNCRRLRGQLAGSGLPLDVDDSPIVPVVVGSSERAMAMAARLGRRGFDVRAVRPPTVPAATSRLRISIHADRTDDELDALAGAVVEELA